MLTDPLRPWHGLDIQFTRSEARYFLCFHNDGVGQWILRSFLGGQMVDGKSIGEIAPDLLALIPQRPRKRRTVEHVLTKRSWITDISGL
jgi:hypothetical protein